MKKTHIAMLVAFALISVAVVVFLPWGIATHEEPGFLNPTATWSHVPLTVGCRNYNAGGDGCDAAEEVVSRVNSRVSFALLQYQGADSTADIEVIMRAPVDVGADERDEPGGHYEMEGAYEHCTVRTMNVSGGASDLELLVLYHEIGHCLGLDHDDEDRSGPLSRDSIMRPVQSPTPDMQMPNTLDDWDVDLLRAKYGND